MEKKESLTRRHIVEVASRMVAESGSESFRIVDLAEQAHIGVPTIYYHFESRSQVIAEAQMANYFAMTEQLHKLLSRAETAISLADADEFWDAVRANIVGAWSRGQFDEKRGVIKLLMDVWNDTASRVRFRELLDIQFARWVALVDDAKGLGWINPELDSQALVGIFWAASIGQVVTSGSAYVDIAPEVIGDFYVSLARAASPEVL
ncbi:MAG: TetR/AcrR family transcriptional regulator [Acidobacteriota bacterium]|nr:TetR/AcrR family transcriptional regulator [Acidobacteriota bacterium]